MKDNNNQSYNASISRSYSHLNSAVAILQAYNGGLPFAHFIKAWFGPHKKFGSKDRRQIAQLCYSYFRLGKSYSQLPIEQKILKGLQLSAATLTPEWQVIINEHELPHEAPDHIFPCKQYLSKSIDSTAFEQSHLIQPDLFLRIRPGYERDVAEKLSAQNIPYHFIDGAVCLPNHTKIENELVINKEVVVQDLSSQRVGELLAVNKSQILNQKSAISVWDCCAASGGKSILAKDILGSIALTVSDIRASIIANLKKRFREAGLNHYRSFIADATTAAPDAKFDLVIADVPCSGSGTWARTPEQLLYFSPSQIASYATVQKCIVTNATRYIKPGGFLLYITCSVFEKENEKQVEQMREAGLQLVEQKLITGYRHKADTMFAALLKK